MIILHGENIVLSRQKLKEKSLDFKKKTKGEILFFNGSTELINIQQAFQSLSLLGEHQLVIIENLFGGKKSKEKEKIIAFIKDLQPKNLIIWEGKKIDGRLLSSFQGQVLRFDLTPVLFHFLDSLRPGNIKASIILLHQTLEQLPAEMIFFMLVKHFRLLILATDLGKKGLKSMPSWRQGKLISQGHKFGLERLLKIYQRLLRIDCQQKTGKTPFNLSSQLDLLIASL